MTSNAAAAPAAGLPVDAHVHFHDAGCVGPTLDAAAANFGALRLASTGPARGALLLAQSRRERVFEWLREQVRVGRWHVATARDEPQSLWLREDVAEILVVCGSQV